MLQFSNAFRFTTRRILSLTISNNELVFGLQQLFQKYPARRSSIIPLLQEVQEHYGYISSPAVDTMAEYLGVSASEIYGVASFYTQFKFTPPGKYVIQICQGTACHVRASSIVLEALREELNIEPGHTTTDGLFTLERVACVGCCALAPVMAVNGKVYAQMTQEKVREVIKEYRQKEDNKTGVEQ